MNLDPQRRGAGRSRWPALAAFMLVAGSWGTGAARADIYVHVMNCTADNLYVQAFDAKDSTEAVAASHEQFAADNSGEGKQLHCAGEGEGYCKMVVQILDTPSSSSCSGTTSTVDLNFHLDSGKWAVVTGFTAIKDSNGWSRCQAVVENDLDAAPSSCD